MEFHFIQVICIVLLSIAQLVLGMACGWWLKERRIPGDDQPANDTRSLAPRLIELSHYAAACLATNGRIAKVEPCDPGDPALAERALVAADQVTAALTALHQRLARAERQLQEQSQLIGSFEPADQVVEALGVG
jgi:hypothetical protein